MNEKNEFDLSWSLIIFGGRIFFRFIDTEILAAEFYKNCLNLMAFLS